ncbi:protein translocase SEC61 complex subunit gamma [archaeon]|jgi:protein transport protein SEC61 subunit gamma and related proteins|nr:protein translocase SEC61 complex subunit gamma [archaeon]MBT6823866.1 protein translocase SEC61 complex subunit gamma [archaeon]MBT7107397.1 protein translocase SEC61 complex subunit gamma [archaeon]MBT7297209.1 protein translocase SEC61 complex subunit gamma [archaeon]
MEHEQIKESGNVLSKLKRFIFQCKRVFKITKKPSNDEYKVIVKVTGIGILIIGAIGFLIHLIWKIID